MSQIMDVGTFRNIDAFWAWVKQHEKDFTYANLSGHLLRQIQERAGTLLPGIGVEIRPRANHSFDLIFTAFAKPELANRVKAIVERAPRLQYLRPIAFRPAVDDPSRLEFRGVSLDHIKVAFSQEGGSTQLRIYAVHWPIPQPLAEAYFLLIELALGEAILIERIDDVSLCAPDDAGATSAHPGSRIREVFTAFKARYTH